jgi:hypothetical protein
MSFADSFRAARWIRSANLVLQAILFTTLFSGLNYLAIHYAWRHDLTQHRRHSLSPETRSYLKNLRADVEVIVTLTDDPENEAVAQAYARRVRVAAGVRLRHRWQRAGPGFRHRPRAGSPSATSTSSGNGGRRGRPRRAAQRDRRDLRRAPPQPRSGGIVPVSRTAERAFRGEQALTAAILDVNQPEPTRLYFLMGHGEMRADDTDATRGLSAGATSSARGTSSSSASPQTRRILDDAALLIIAAPRARTTRLRSNSSARG